MKETEVIEEVLQKIKFVLECKNEAQAKRILEQFIFFIQEKNSDFIKRYEVDFDGNVLAGIEVKNNSINIYGAMNGHGNAINLNDINIKEVII